MDDRLVGRVAREQHPFARVGRIHADVEVDERTRAIDLGRERTRFEVGPHDLAARDAEAATGHVDLIARRPRA